MLACRQWWHCGGGDTVEGILDKHDRYFTLIDDELFAHIFNLKDTDVTVGIDICAPLSLLDCFVFHDFLPGGKNSLLI